MHKLVGTANEIIKPMCWLIGKWNSTSAKGKFPTIKPFEYCEALEFSFFGQPMLQYISKTFMDSKPVHFETGYLRIKPCTNTVSLLIAHNIGMTSVEEGEIRKDSMSLKSCNIGRMSFGNEPAVCQIIREYTACGNTMELVACMCTSKTPLTEHFRVKYKKEDKC